MAVLLQEIEDESKKIPYNFPEIKSIDSADELDLNHEKWRIFGKKDGLEVQAVKHENSVHLWSREGDLITDQFPEIVESISMDTPNFKCYGQILPKNEGIPLDQLLARLNKKSISKKAISNCEAVFELWEVLVGDAIETHNQLSDYPLIQTPKSINISSNDDLIRQHNNCRNLGFTGFILKPKDQAIFYSWKAASFSVKAILLYVEFGGMDNAGIRSITFGVYSQKDLFPIAKILDFEDIFDADTVVRYVKENTIERFGPVRTVKPQLVYEIEFDGISKSSRRKSGLVLTNPKISQKVGNDPAKANDLQYLKDLL